MSQLGRADPFRASGIPELQRLAELLSDALAEVDRVQGERSGLLRELQAQNLALTDAVRAKDEFLGLVSHELRTPLTTITGNAAILRNRFETLDRDSAAGALDDVIDSADRLSAIIENMLALARLERGMPIELEPCLVRRHAARIIDRHRRRHPGRVIELDAQDTPATVLCSPTYLEQILDNLLTNAGKYGGEGPITVRIETSERELRLSVLDRGPGIDHVEGLFTPFHRGDRDLHKPGMGLGLALCKRLVDAQGGHIWAMRRDDGRGSNIGFALPLFEEQHTPD